MKTYQIILQELLKQPGGKSVNDSQIQLQCPICKHKDNKLYVGVIRRLLPKERLGYDCKHCGFTGGVSKKFLQKFNINLSKEVLESLKFEKKQFTKIINPVTKMTKMDYKIPNIVLPEDEFKLRYLSMRFKRPLNKSDIQTYKIVLNVKEFYKYNNINIDELLGYDKEKIRKQKFMIEEYSKNFVGMLTVDNNKINLRNINSQRFDQRYMIHVINPNLSNPYLYIPDIPVDLLSKQPSINMAEGVYDIIGAKELYFLDDDDYSNIFAAVGSRPSYIRALQQILKMTGFLNADVKLFVDYDGEDYGIGFYRDMFKPYRNLFPNIYVNYNVAIDEDGKPCKDFGNLSKPVKLKRYRI